MSVRSPATRGSKAARSPRVLTRTVRLVLLALLLAVSLLLLLSPRLEDNAVPTATVLPGLAGALLAAGLLGYHGGLRGRGPSRGQRTLEGAEFHAARHEAEEAQLARLVSQAGDAILFIDEVQRITLINSSARSLFGYDAREVLGQPLELLLPQHSRVEPEQVLRHLAWGAMLSRRMGRIQSLPGVRKGGERFPAEAVITPLETDGRRMATVVLRDVSEPRREESEQRLLVRAGELLSSTSLDYERTLSRVAELAVQWPADWCLVYLKDEERVRLAEVAHRDAGKRALAARMKGLYLDARLPYLSRAVIDQRRPLLLPRIPSEGLAAVAQSYEHLEILKDLAPYSYVGVPLIANERVLGALVLICSESKRIFDAKHLAFAGQLGRLSSLALDNARLYQQARQAAQARDEVLGIVAHDLRTPLHTITLATQGLQHQAGRTPVDAREDASLEGVRQRRLAMIASAAGTMERLIEDMLDVSRLEAGRTLSMRMSAPSAKALLQDAMETALLRAEEVHLVLDPTGALPSVRGDRDRLLQVLSNLVGNALKFTPGGGQVRLGARVEGEQVEFYVADTGPGMSAESRAHLFERFWQANAQDRRGAGLGLSIVKGIIEAHGGRVRVESEPGQGTTVFFSVPIASGDASAVQSAP